ncbi:transcriptional regulator, DeoR family [Agrococcus baldri]|uniref:Transcriptional regulator, DeoR family n=1 Tax=Agrococcus baldri TaxID=153730 RepID=A0AA94KZ14_9MICO|nr:transcriptional regulator, DeoR family [Agrococcus baldri]
MEAGLLDVERRERITAHLRRTSTARIADLAVALGVSAMTVRRDAEKLAASGVIERVRGGVRILRAPVTEEPAPSEKAALHPEAKERIARAALALVRPGSAVGIGGGTTTLALARLLADVPDITIVTNSLPVALALPDHDSLVMIGGERSRSDALVGPVANRAAASIGLDQLFLGAHGIDADRGCTAPSLAEAETNRALMAATRETVAMIDASKWGVQGLAAFADLGELDTLVTDASLPHAQTREVRRTIGRVLLA